jgi:LacI family transcriptional regulator
MVIIDRKVPGIACDSILVDNRDAAKKAVDILIGNGHTHIGLVTGPEEIYTARERCKGYEQALQEAGLPVDPELIVHSDYTIRGAAAGAKKLLEHSGLTAIFAANYELTMGTMIAVNEAGIRIPEELSLIGFDNQEFARALQPSLTIITQPTGQIARRAAEMILERLESEADPPPREIYLKTEVMEGRSVQRAGG